MVYLQKILKIEKSRFCNYIVSAQNELVDNHKVKCKYESQVDAKSVKLKARKNYVNIFRKLYMIKGGIISMRKFISANILCIIELQTIYPCFLGLSWPKLLNL